jgi:intein/homing endonuclease
LRAGDLIAVPRSLPEFGEAYALPALPVQEHHLETPCRVPAESNVDLLWLLGLFIGDGNLQDSGKTHRIQFAIPASDTELRQEISRVVREQFGLRAIEADEYRLVVNSKALVDWFWQIGFHGNSHSKRVPDWVFGLPAEQRLAFLGGWVDADGYVGPASSDSVVLTCVSSQLLEQAKDLADLCLLRTSGLHGFTQPYRHDPWHQR